MGAVGEFPEFERALELDLELANDPLLDPVFQPEAGPTRVTELELKLDRDLPEPTADPVLDLVFESEADPTRVLELELEFNTDELYVGGNPEPELELDQLIGEEDDGGPELVLLRPILAQNKSRSLDHSIYNQASPYHQTQKYQLLFQCSLMVCPEIVGPERVQELPE